MRIAPHDPPRSGTLSGGGAVMGVRYASPEHLARCAGAPVQVCKLVFAVAESDPVMVAALRSDSTDEDTVRMRRAVLWTAKLHTNASFPEIARALGKDHSSLIRSLGRAVVQWADDHTFRALCAKIATAISPIGVASASRRHEPELLFERDTTNG